MANCPDISRFLDKIMTKLIICDIDNTLLFTDKLNNKAYIYGQVQMNGERWRSVVR